MKLTPGQACFLYGWLGAKITLNWEDIINSSSIDFDKLLQANLSVDQIFQIQPDFKVWLRYNKVKKHNIPCLLTKWDVNVVEDFKLDLGDIISEQLSPETLLKYGINYEKLLEMGLTQENMFLLKHITLIGWSTLGFNKKHAENIPEPHLFKCFRMSKIEVIRSLKSEIFS